MGAVKPWHMLVLLLLLLVIIAVVVVIVVIATAAARRAQPLATTPQPAGPVPPHEPTPREILDRRLAAGEIDTDEYGRLRSRLEKP